METILAGIAFLFVWFVGIEIRLARLRDRQEGLQFRIEAIESIPILTYDAEDDGTTMKDLASRDKVGA